MERKKERGRKRREVSREQERFRNRQERNTVHEEKRERGPAAEALYQKSTDSQGIHGSNSGAMTLNWQRGLAYFP